MLLNEAEINQLKTFSQQNKTLYVGLSGGVDSVALLTALHQLKMHNPQAYEFSLAAIHIHHGLSPNADDWLSFCQSLCQQLKIPFHVRQIKLKPASRQSIEALAREARYKAFDEVTPAKSIIVTAQHLDDQAETFLLRVKRGSGPAGLASMQRLTLFHQRSVQSRQDKLLWRPLLNLSKSEIIEFARQQQLSWVEDESNQNNDFDRNFIRNRILPQLTERWPGISRCIARTTRLCQQQNELLDEFAALDYQACRINSSLDICQLVRFSLARRYHLLRYWLKQHGFQMPSEKVLLEIDNLISAKVDSQPLINLKQGQIRRFQNQLIVLNEHDLAALDIPQAPINWQQQAQVSINSHLAIHFIENNSGDGFRPPRNNELAQIRFAIPGQTICQPNNRAHSRTIKKLLQEYQIPSWQRSSVAYLFYNESLVSALGLWVCKGYEAEPGKRGFIAELYDPTRQL